MRVILVLGAVPPWKNQKAQGSQISQTGGTKPGVPKGTVADMNAPRKVQAIFEILHPICHPRTGPYAKHAPTVILQLSAFQESWASDTVS